MLEPKIKFDALLNKPIVYISTLNSILNSGKELGVEIPHIKKSKDKNGVVFIFKDGVRDKLLSCYTKSVQPIFITLAYQGFREQECLQLLWEDILFKEATIIIRTSKNGETRMSPMHPKVWWTLARHWIKSGKPTSGHVWITYKGLPYRDGRKGMGGSPLLHCHRTALKRLKSNYGIDLKMRVHDFRHGWCSSMVMAGVDLLTVQKLGGWKSFDMVKRYASLSAKHEREAIRKI